MTIFQSIILGIVQGLSEFLPISSSAHLVIVPYLLNWQMDPKVTFVFDVLVQVATLLAVITYFWKDLIKIFKAFILGIIKKQPFSDSDSRLGWLLLLGTLPAVILGLFLKERVEKAFSNVLFTGLALIMTAVILIIAERIGKRQKELYKLSGIDAVIIGLAQACAIFPGLSRSGLTIAGGMSRQLTRETAARFSFLLSIPIMVAAGVIATSDLLKQPEAFSHIIVFLPGFIAAATTGYIAIRWFLKFLTRRSLYDFAIYCWLVGLIAVAVYLIK